MNLAENIQRLQKNRDLQKIEISEWTDEKGNPAIVYFMPMTVEDSISLTKLGINIDKTNVNAAAMEMMIPLIVMKALDKDGNRAFSEDNDYAHARMLRKEPLSAVQKIFEAVMLDEKDIEKN